MATTKKVKKYEKQKKIEATIKTLVDSFLSHICYIYLPHEDGKKFHRDTAYEYLARIKDQLDLL